MIIFYDDRFSDDSAVYLEILQLPTPPCQYVYFYRLSGMKVVVILDCIICIEISLWYTKVGPGAKIYFLVMGIRYSAKSQTQLVAQVN